MCPKTCLSDELPSASSSLHMYMLAGPAPQWRLCMDVRTYVDGILSFALEVLYALHSVQHLTLAQVVR